MLAKFRNFYFKPSAVYLVKKGSSNFPHGVNLYMDGAEPSVFFQCQEGESREKLEAEIVEFINESILNDVSQKIDVTVETELNTQKIKNLCADSDDQSISKGIKQKKTKC